LTKNNQILEEMNSTSQSLIPFIPDCANSCSTAELPIALIDKRQSMFRTVSTQQRRNTKSHGMMIIYQCAYHVILF